MADKALFEKVALRSTIRILEARTQDVMNAISRADDDIKYEEAVREGLLCQIDRLNRDYNFYQKKDLEYLKRSNRAQEILETSLDPEELLKKYTVIPLKVPDDKGPNSTLDETEEVPETDEDIEESPLVQELRELRNKIAKNDEYVMNTMEDLLKRMKFVAEFPDEELLARFPFRSTED